MKPCALEFIFLHQKCTKTQPQAFVGKKNFSGGKAPVRGERKGKDGGATGGEVTKEERNMSWGWWGMRKGEIRGGKGRGDVQYRNTTEGREKMGREYGLEKLATAEKKRK